MPLIDTHCHLDAHYFDEGPEAILQRAREASVGAFVVIGVGENSKAARNAISLAETYPYVVATAGIHPHEAEHATPELRNELRELVTHKQVVAVGEIGLDYHYDHSPRATQAEVFRYFIQLAREVKKPMVIHTRSAPEETIQILREEKANEAGGVIHCFSEDKAFAKQALDLGFYLSFSGIVTFKKAQSIQEVAAWAPVDRIMVETDSPYLAPVPFRGKRCEPAYVVHTAQAVAKLRGVDYSLLEQQTTLNAQTLFGSQLQLASQEES
jgi:TatD DNase family protein